MASSPSQELAPNWSADGKYIAYHTLDSETGNRDLWYLNIAASGQSVPFLRTDFDELLPQISPDGEHLVYQSNAQGRWQVFATRFPTGEGTQTVSVNGGTFPRWSPRGDEIFFLEDETLMVVAVETDPSLRLGDPKRLFRRRYAGRASAAFTDYPDYNVDVDGQRFVMVRTVQTQVEKSSVVLVENWFAEFDTED